MAQGTIFPKQQIEIVQLLEPKPYGTAGKELLRVMAKNLSLQEGDAGFGKSWKYTVFNQALQDHIKPLQPGARFLADLEERERPDSQYGPDRNIVQIYIDGKPVSQKQGGGGGGWKGRSLEEDLLLESVKRRSVEGQTAIAQVGLALTCPSPLDGDALGLDEDAWKRILDKYWQAVEKSLDNFLAQPKAQAVKRKPAETLKATLAKRDQRPSGDQQTADKTESVSKDQPPPADRIKHIGDLLTRAGKLKPSVNPAEVAEACGVTKTDEVKDLEGCWKKVQAYSKKKANPDPDQLFE